MRNDEIIPKIGIILENKKYLPKAQFLFKNFSKFSNFWKRLTFCTIKNFGWNHDQNDQYIEINVLGWSWCQTLFPPKKWFLPCHSLRMLRTPRQLYCTHHTPPSVIDCHNTLGPNIENIDYRRRWSIEVDSGSINTTNRLYSSK